MVRNVFFIAIFLFSGSTLLAQTKNDTKKVFLDLNSGIPVINTTFTDTWDPSPSLHANVRVPFYTGRVEAGIRYIRFKGMAPTSTDSDFSSIFIHLGYSYPFPLSARFQVEPTIRFGNNLMLFDKTKTYTSGSFIYNTDPAESEFAYEFALRNQLQLSRHWFVHATVSYNRTLTRFPISLPLLSAGISYSFSQPEWLKNFLQ